MKKLLILLAIFTSIVATAQSVGINADGAAASASAMLDVSSTTKGFLPPRMTGAQRATITSPAQGLMIYCTDCGSSGEPQYYDGTQWKKLIGGTATTSTARVTIGTQVWATVNLDVTTYRDGTTIPQVTDPTQWSNLTTGAWCYYNNNSSSGTTYGKLYNWYAVAGIHDADPNTPNKVLAPTGWHLPTDAEWTTLTNTLGGIIVAGGKLKATGTSLWDTPNTDATNSSGFSGLPGGGRSYNGTFTYVGTYGYWWSSSQGNISSAWLRYLAWNFGDAVSFNGNNRHGFSVRCLRD
jgi:uncharacterized protein (TIGR02145 family)